jgi:glucose-1-phosphate cytidylyltransferase
MKTVILAGGFGSRLAEETVVRPKPMVDVGDHPILWHILNIYSAHGFREFLIALGYKGEVIKQYFLDFHSLSSDLTVDVCNGRPHLRATSNGHAPGWRVHLIDTGLKTQTGGRLKRLAPHLDSTFLMTYGDGVGDVDITRLVEFHKAHGKLATITAVHPPARLGGLVVSDGDTVVEFGKTQVDTGWINGGFFVLEPKVLDYIDDDLTAFEREPLSRLAADGELVAYTHDGFWKAMDTLREKKYLDKLWASGEAPWKIW